MALVALSAAGSVELKQAEQAVQQAKGELSAKLQMLSNQRSFVGDAYGAMAAFDESKRMVRAVESSTPEDAARLTAAKAEDAIAAIVREAASHRVVILNEAHHAPLHRAFAMRLARELKRIGYSWLACETFEKTPFQKGYLARSDGYYSQEPVFGNFIRDAVADGWTLVQYEPMDGTPTGTFAEQIEQRERGEARNLVERVFAKDANAKVFIYVGYSHAKEVPRVGDGTGSAWMAAQLRHLTGLDPLTIDQTTLTEHVMPEIEHPLYAAAIQRGGAAPFVLRTPNGGYEVFGKYRNAMDMQVVHPRYGVDADSGRYGWMRSIAGLQPADAPKEMLATTTPRYIYAYLQGQPDDAVPVDVIQVVPGKTPPKFMLPKGAFRFVAE